MITVGATPWARRGLGNRVPVGVVERDGERISPPQPPYWAVVFDDASVRAPRLTEQNALRRNETRKVAPEPGAVEPGAVEATTAEPTDEARSHRVVVGGFYPLVLEGNAVADRFPGRGIRSARVVIARRNDDRVVIITVSGTRPGRRGVTTVELADYIASLGYRWALNLDGGRSAYVALPDGTVLPRRVLFRRPGPTRLVFMVP